MTNTPQESYAADHELDTRGLFCPEPVMMLHNKVNDMDSNQIVKVIASDPSTRRDIPKFCNFLDHTLLAQNEDNGEFVYWIKKG